MQEKYNTILEAVFTHAENMPDKVAVIDAEGKTTYGELAAMIRTAATNLRERGVKKGDRVLFSAPPEICVIAAFHAAQYIGAIPATIPKDLPLEEVKYRIDLLECKFAFLDDASAQKLHTKKLTELTVEVINETVKPITINANDIACIRFTSATTGKAKAVLLTHKFWCKLASDYIAMFKIKADIVWLNVDQLGRFGWKDISPVFAIGGTIVLAEKSIKSIYTMIQSNKCTVLRTTGTEINAFIRYTKNDISKILGGLKILLIGSMPTSIELKGKLLCDLPCTDIYDAYGSTEAIDIISHNLRLRKDKLGSVGKPLHRAEVKFVDENNNEIKSSLHNPGRIAVKNDGLMLGYLNNEEATKKALVDGWLLMNDIGYMDDDGYVHILGRSDDIINTDGRKVSPLEIEDCASAFAGISECCCIPVADPLGLRGQVPVLYVTLRDDTMFSEKLLFEHLSKYLDRYKLPYKIVLIDEIPKNSRGKYLRRELVNIWTTKNINS